MLALAFVAPIAAANVDPFWYLPEVQSSKLVEARELLKNARGAESCRLLEQLQTSQENPSDSSEEAHRQYLLAFCRMLQGRFPEAADAAYAFPGITAEDRARIAMLRTSIQFMRRDRLSAVANASNAAMFAEEAFPAPHPARVFAAVQKAIGFSFAFHPPQSDRMALGLLGTVQKELPAIAYQNPDRIWGPAVLALGITGARILIQADNAAEAQKSFTRVLDYDKKLRYAVADEYPGVMAVMNVYVPYSRPATKIWLALAEQLQGKMKAASSMMNNGLIEHIYEHGSQRTMEIMDQVVDIATTKRGCDVMDPLLDHLAEGIEHKLRVWFTAFVMNKAGYCWMNRSGGDAVRAEAMFDRQLQLLSKASDVDPVQAGTAFNNYGWAKQMLGKHAEAIEPYRRALKLRRTVFRVPHWHIAQAAFGLASSIAMSGKLPNEQALKAEAIEALKIILETDAYRKAAPEVYGSAACLASSGRVDALLVSEDNKAACDQHSSQLNKARSR